MGWRPPFGDAADRKNRTEVWRTGMVWESDGIERAPPCGPIADNLDNIIIKEAKGGGSW